MTQPQQETRLIHCYDMVSFVAEIEKAVKQGFSLDFKKNEHYPVQIGYQFVTTMIKGEEQSVAKADAPVNTPVQEPTTPVEAPETTEGTQSTPEVLEAVVEAPKKAAGRPAKGK